MTGTSSSAVETATTWERFQVLWGGTQNILMGGEVFPYSFRFPPLEELLEALRRDEKVRITRGTVGDRLDFTDVSAEFRARPIEEALRAPYQIAHGSLARLWGPGQVLEGLDRIVAGWERTLAEHEFTWLRMNPILFYSGPGTQTNYHLDRSFVLAWQVLGTKRFCWLKDPERWCPAEVRQHLEDASRIVRPDGIGPDDEIRVEMHPGDVLWNVVGTPHWVGAADEPTYSVNIAHWDLRHRGRLSRLGQEVHDILVARGAYKA